MLAAGNVRSTRSRAPSNTGAPLAHARPIRSQGVCSVASAADEPQGASFRSGVASAHVPRARHLRIPGGRVCVACKSEPSTSTKAVGEIQRIELGTREAQQALQFQTVRFGKSQAIAVSAVAEGSEAWQAGIRPGNILKGISDPNRSDQVWELNDMSSFRFVKDAFRMNMSQKILLDIADAGTDIGPVWAAAQTDAPVAAQKVTSESSMPDSQEANVSASVISGGSLLENIAESMTDESGSDAESGETVAAKLERKYRQQQQQSTRVEDRIQARREYLEAQGRGDNRLLFAGTAALFFLPAAVILIWAFSSGYLDTLSSRY